MEAIPSYINTADCHNHSGNSYDGRDPVRDMCARAAALSIKHHCLTDHCECDEYDRKPQDYRSVVINSYRDMCAAREEFNLLLGIELGQPLHGLEAAEDALAGREYDFVLGSQHRVRDAGDFYFWKDMGLTVDAALQKYFDEVKEMLAWGKFDALGHLTYPLRYIVGDHGIAVDYSRYMEVTREIYRMLIERGIALEINTAGLRQKIGELSPNQSLIRLYREVGGELITLGSDAHCCEDLGKGIQEAMALLDAAGYTHYSVFKQRKPMMIEIK